MGVKAGEKSPKEREKEGGREREAADRGKGKKKKRRREGEKRMRKKGRSLKRLLALLLAVVLTVTYVPTDGLVVRAAEDGQQTEETANPDADTVEKAATTGEETTSTEPQTDGTTSPEESKDGEVVDTPASGDPTDTEPVDGTTEEGKKEETEGPVSDGSGNENGTGEIGSNSTPSVDDTENNAGGSGTNNQGEAASNDTVDTPADENGGSGDADTTVEPNGAAPAQNNTEPAKEEADNGIAPVNEIMPLADGEPAAQATTHNVTIKLEIDENGLPEGVADFIVGPADIDATNRQFITFKTGDETKHLQNFVDAGANGIQFSVTEETPVFFGVKWKNPGIDGQMNMQGLNYMTDLESEVNGYAYETTDGLKDVFKLTPTADKTVTIWLTSNVDGGNGNYYNYKIVFHKPTDVKLDYQAEFVGENHYAISNGESEKFVYHSNTDTDETFYRFICDEDTPWVYTNGPLGGFDDGNDDGYNYWNEAEGQYVPVKLNDMKLKVTTEGITDETGHWVVKCNGEALEKEGENWLLPLSGLANKAETGTYDLDITWETAEVSVNTKDEHIADKGGNTPNITISGDALDDKSVPAWDSTNGLVVDKALMGKKLTVEVVTDDFYKPEWKTTSAEGETAPELPEFTAKTDATPNTWTCDLTVPEDKDENGIGIGFAGEIVTAIDPAQVCKVTLGAGAEDFLNNWNITSPTDADQIITDGEGLKKVIYLAGTALAQDVTIELTTDSTKRLDVSYGEKTAEQTREKTYKIPAADNKIGTEISLKVTEVTTTRLEVDYDEDFVSSLILESKGNTLLEKRETDETTDEIIKYYEISGNDELELTLVPNTGMKINRVLAGTEELTANSQGKYTVLNSTKKLTIQAGIDAENTFKMEFPQGEYKVTVGSADTRVEDATGAKQTATVDNGAGTTTVDLKDGARTIYVMTGLPIALTVEFTANNVAGTDYQLGKITYQENGKDSVTVSGTTASLANTVAKVNNAVSFAVKCEKPSTLTIKDVTADVSGNNGKVTTRTLNINGTDGALNAASYSVISSDELKLTLDVTDPTYQLEKIVRTEGTGESQKTTTIPLSGANSALKDGVVELEPVTADTELTIYAVLKADQVAGTITFEGEHFTAKAERRTDASTPAPSDNEVYGKDLPISVKDTNKFIYIELANEAGYRITDVTTSEDGSTEADKVIKKDVGSGKWVGTIDETTTKKNIKITVTTKEEQVFTVLPVDGAQKTLIQDVKFQTVKGNTAENISGSAVGSFSGANDYTVLKDDQKQLLISFKTGTTAADFLKDNELKVNWVTLNPGKTAVESIGEALVVDTEGDNIVVEVAPGTDETKKVIQISAVAKTKYSIGIEGEQLQDIKLGGTLYVPGSTYTTDAQADITVSAVNLKSGYVLTAVKFNGEKLEETAGSYTIQGNKITVNSSLVVETAKEYQATVHQNSGTGLQLGYINEGKFVGIDAVINTGSSDISRPFNTSQDLALKLADEHYKATVVVKSVATAEAPEKVLKTVDSTEKDKDDVVYYPLGKFEQAIRIETTATVDAEKTWGILFEGENYTAKVTKDSTKTGVTSGLPEGGVYGPGKDYLPTLATPAGKIFYKVEITPKKGYRIDDVQIDNGKDSEKKISVKDDSLIYTYIFEGPDYSQESVSETAKVTMNVTTSLMVPTYLKIVADKDAKISFKVDENDFVQQKGKSEEDDPDRFELWRVDSKAGKVTLRVTRPDNKTTVSATWFDGVPLVRDKGEKDDLEYVYTLTGEDLYKKTNGKTDKALEITLKETPTTRPVKVVDENGAIESITAKVNGEETTGATYDKEVRYNDTVEFEIKAKDNYSLTEVQYGKASAFAADASEEAKKGIQTVSGSGDTITLSVKMDTDEKDGILVKVKGKAEISLNPLKLNDNIKTPVEPEKDGSYYVDAGTTYILSALRGATPLTLSKVVVDGKEIKAGSTEYKLQVKNDAEGSIKAELYYKESVTEKDENGNDKVTQVENLAGTYNLNVRPILTDLTIGNANEDGSISQLIGTTVEYPLTAVSADQKEANLKDLYVKAAQSNSAISAKIEKGLLIVTVANQASASGKTAKFNIYRSKTSKDVLKTVNVSVKDPVLKESPIEAEFVRATAKKLTIKATAPKGQVPVTYFDENDNKTYSKIYYKVDFKKLSSANDKTVSPELEASPVYIEWNGEESQTFDVTVFGDPDEKKKDQIGTAWNFDVTVTMVQAEKTVSAGKAKYTVVSSGKAVPLSGVQTKELYYDTNLLNMQMKKSSKTIYTGQKEAEIATIMLEEKTSVMDLKTVELDGNLVYGLDEQTGQYRYFRDDLNNVHIESDGRVIADIGKGLSATKTHTLEIELMQADDSISPKASVSFKVVKGIYNLALSGVPRQVQKVENKAITIKAQPIYNGGEKEDAPKTKKVEWMIGKSYDGTKMIDFTPTDRLYGMVTLKNGTVTINKNYTVSGKEADNTFVLMAKAADYAGNDTVTDPPYEVTVTSEALELGSVVIARKNDMTGQYDVVADSSTASISADKLANTEVIVLRSGAKSAKSYDSEDVISKANYSLKSSNKAVDVNSNNTLNLAKFTKPVKNLKITATTVGNTKKATSVLTLAMVDYAEVGKLGIEFEIDGQLYNSNPAATQNSITFAGTPGSTIKITVGQQTKNDPSKWSVIVGKADYQLKLKGIKSVATDERDKNIQYLTMNKDSATIELTNSKKEPIAIYTLTNTKYNTNKAPKFTTKGSLKPTEASEGQGLTYTLGLGKGESMASYNGKYVLIQADTNSFYKKGKTSDNYKMFWRALSKESTTWAQIEDGKIELMFEGPINKGSYKLWFTVGTFDSKGNFLAETKTSSVGVKVAVPKKNNFKPNTTYTMSLIDNSKIRFTGPGKNVKDVVVIGLYNDTIDGRNNDFINYFVTDKDKNGNDTNIIRVNVDTKKSGWLDNIKKNCTGYVEYKVQFTDGTFSTDYEKITINFTEEQARTYTLSQPKVLKSEEEVLVYIDVLADKEPVDVDAAEITEKGGLTAAIDKDKTKESGRIALKVKGTTEGQSYNLAFKFHPEASFYDEKDTKGWINNVSTTLKVEKKTAVKKVAMAKNSFKLTGDDYNEKTGAYEKDVPYTQNIFANVSEIKSSNSVVKFVPNNDGSFTITVKKAALASSNAFGQTLGTDKKNPLTAEFVFGDGTKSEIFNLTLQLPEKPITLDEAVDAVIEMRDSGELAKTVTEAYTGYSEKHSTSFVDADAKAAIINALQEKINAILTKDSEIAKVDLSKITITFNSVIANKIGAFGIDLKKGSTTETVQVADIDFDKTFSELEHYYSKLIKYINNKNTRYSTETNVTEETILEDANESLELPANFRLFVEKSTIQAATDATPFKYKATWGIRDLKERTSKETSEDGVVFTGAILKGTEGVMKALDKKIKDLNANGYGCVSDSSDDVSLFITNAITQDDLLAYLKAVVENQHNDNIEVTISDFDLTKATDSAKGNIIFAVVLKNEKTALAGNAEAEETRKIFEIAVNKTKAKADIVTALGALGSVSSELVRDCLDKDISKTESNLLEEAKKIVGSAEYQTEIRGCVYDVQPTYKDAGKISYRIILTDSEGKETEAVIVNEQDVAEVPYFQTVEDVEEIITASERDFMNNIRATDKVTGSTLAINIKSTIEKSVIADGSKIDIAIQKVVDPKNGSEVDNISYTAPTVNSKGSIAIAFELIKDSRSETRKVVNFTYDEFEELSQTFDVAVKEAKEAVKNLDARDIIDAASVLSAVNAVIKAEKYQADVTYTEGSNNKATISVTITESDSEEGKEPRSETFKEEKAIL